MARNELDNTLSPRALIIMAVIAGGAGLLAATGHWRSGLGALTTFVSEGGLALVIFTAAAGFGGLVVRRLTPQSAPVGLKVTTACGVGLWGLSTLMLAVGSSFDGLLSGWVWWPVIAIGVLLAVWQLRDQAKTRAWPEQLHARSLVWVLIVAATAIWLALATRPAGYVGLGPDEYDVLEYHLQLPREYYDAGRISPLAHNVYSHYPAGVEMLSLLAMCLRGGPYAGMYAAKLIHGLFAVLAVAAVMSSLRGENDLRGRFGGVLLATTPFVISLGWLAMVELAQVCYLTLALLWLRCWLAERQVASALWIGVMLGAACATKYLAVGFLVGPVVVAMLVTALSSRQRATVAWHVVPALAATAMLFSPWLIRNTAATGNPVFPLATHVFGRGHWSGESEQRWIDGHGPAKLPPVPKPADWQMPRQDTRLTRFTRDFVTHQIFGPFVKVLATVAVCLLVASRWGTDPWDWSLVAVAAGQLAVWVLWTHEMPPRFLVPLVVPMALLGAGLLQQIFRMTGNPFRHDPFDGAGRRWGAPTAVIVLVMAALTNLMAVFGAARQATPGVVMNGQPVASVARSGWQQLALPEQARAMLVGEARAYYMPPETVYATTFDAHPLAEMLETGLSPQDVLAKFQADGITHIIVNWEEIVRLAHTYGHPASLSADVLTSYEGQWPTGQWRERPALTIIEQLKPLGLKDVTKMDAEANGDRPLRWIPPSTYAVPEVADPPETP
ncbi:MAG: ArnT family glycosyltransferase [Planctomycetota bacterium]|jgi:hypothetical protein